MIDVLIIGFGIVGHNLYNELLALQPDVYDIKYKSLDMRKEHYDFAFICVDTPYTKEDPCDWTQVKNAIEENNADIYIINTCTVTNEADKKDRKLINSTRKNHKDSILIVMGCYSQSSYNEINADTIKGCTC